jgi:hypothetical protein
MRRKLVYDAAQPGDRESAVSRIKEILAKLSADDRAELEELAGFMERAAMDEPPDFEGKPKPGGTMVPIYKAFSEPRPPAQDGALDSFLSRYPNAARIAFGAR